MNVGYSYGKSKVKNTQESAIDVYAFLQLFLDEYKEYASNPFHIAGESYGKGNNSIRLSFSSSDPQAATISPHFLPRSSKGIEGRPRKVW